MAVAVLLLCGFFGLLGLLVLRSFPPRTPSVLEFTFGSLPDAETCQIGVEIEPEFNIHYVTDQSPGFHFQSYAEGPLEVTRHLATGPRLSGEEPIGWFYFEGKPVGMGNSSVFPTSDGRCQGDISQSWRFIPKVPGRVRFRVEMSVSGLDQPSEPRIIECVLDFPDQIPETIAAAHKKLLTKLESDDPAVRSSAYSRLADIGTGTVYDCRFLMERFPLEPDPKARADILWGLKELMTFGGGFEAIPFFYKIANDRAQPSSVRAQAVECVSRIVISNEIFADLPSRWHYRVTDAAVIRAKEALNAFASDPDREVAKTARECLSWINRPREAK